MADFAYFRFQYENHKKDIKTGDNIVQLLLWTVPYVSSILNIQLC